MDTSNGDLECLQSIAATENLSVSTELMNQVQEQINNYGDYYHNRFKVPYGDIFYSAVLSAEKLKEICELAPYVRIYIAKQTADYNNQGDFKFIVVPEMMGERGETITGSKLLDANCCRNPPPPIRS